MSANLNEELGQGRKYAKYATIAAIKWP